MGRAVGLVNLLAEEVEPRQDRAARFVGVKLHVVADGVRREEAVDRAELEQFSGDDFVQQLLGIGE